MPDDMDHVAHPRLYGAPAYSRPSLMIARTALPLDPDDFPLAVAQTPQERAIAEQLFASSYGVAEPPTAARPDPQPQTRPVILSALADRFLGRAS